MQLKLWLGLERVSLRVVRSHAQTRDSKAKLLGRRYGLGHDKTRFVMRGQVDSAILFERLAYQGHFKYRRVARSLSGISRAAIDTYQKPRTHKTQRNPNGKYK